MKRAEVSGKAPEKAEGAPEKTVRSGKKKPAERTAGEKPARTVAFLDEEEMNKGDLDAGVSKKSAAKGGGPEKLGATASAEPAAANGRKPSKTGRAKGQTSAKRAKAKKPNEKITPASIYKKMIAFGKIYQIEGEQDFQEAARIYAEEAGLIDQMRDQIAEEGLTVIKSYKTGDVPVAHPLLSELPRHVESANKCLATIGTMIGERGARVEKAKRDLDAFRLH